MGRGTTNPTETPRSQKTNKCHTTAVVQGRGGGGGQDRVDRGLGPEPTPMSHLHPRFLLPSLTVLVAQWSMRPNHLPGVGGGRSEAAGGGG